MLLKSASDANNCTLPYVFTKNARTAWFKVLESISIFKNKKIKLLLPSYIGINDKEGSGVFDAVIKSGADFDFYKVTDNLQIEIGDFLDKIENNNFDVALIIHYFGFSRVNLEQIRNICDSHQIILVEDCAHAFYIGEKNSDIGNYGDFSFYSLHKYLATSTGGMLKINNNDLPKPTIEHDDKIEFTALEKFSSSDFKKIADIRKKNYQAYQERIGSDQNIDVLFSLNDTDIPQTFPIRVKNCLREKLYFYLLDNNIPTVALYYRMIPQIEPRNFPKSLLISSEILNLPVHQDTNVDDVILVCEKIKEFFSNEKS